MKNYFYDMVAAEDMQQLSYIPTVPEFVDWIGKKYADKPALSDLAKTLTYGEFCARIARRRAFIDGLGIPKGSHIAIFDRNRSEHNV